MSQWHAERFTPDERKVRFDCAGCGRPMFFPPSKAGKYKTCGDGCSRKLRQLAKDQRTRSCETCGDPFVPRPRQIRLGQGRYCSTACAMPATIAAAHTPEAHAKTAATLRAAYAGGRRKPLRGEAHPQWTGGRAAWRRKNAAKLAAQMRAKRASHPDRHREYVAKRRGVGRLPRGTIKRIGAAQRWRCAVCRAGIRREYHVDHIVPLARGGQHVPSNLQLLCPSCNMTKNARDPIDFMQSRGFLL